MVVLASVAAGHGGRARADEPRAEEAGGRWQGTSWGFELRSGLSFRARDEAITPAPILGVGFRVCTLLQLVDAELFMQTMAFDREVAAGDHALRRTSIGVDLRLHPLFIRHLQGGFGDRLAASLHLAIGAGVDVLSTVGPGRDRTDVAFAIALGLGSEVPLTEPSARPWSVWLGLGWRVRFVGFPDGAPGLRDMDEHQLLVNLSVRFHDLTGVRWAVPPELDDADR